MHAPIKDCTEPFFIHYCVFVWTSENDKKKRTQGVDAEFWKAEKSVSFQATTDYYTDTLYSNKWKKKRCNKKLEVAAVFYILCIFGGENFTLN